MQKCCFRSRLKNSRQPRTTEVSALCIVAENLVFLEKTGFIGHLGFRLWDNFYCFWSVFNRKVWRVIPRGRWTLICHPDSNAVPGKIGIRGYQEQTKMWKNADPYVSSCKFFWQYTPCPDVLKWSSKHYFKWKWENNFKNEPKLLDLRKMSYRHGATEIDSEEKPLAGNFYFRNRMRFIFWGLQYIVHVAAPRPMDVLKITENVWLLILLIWF